MSDTASKTQRQASNHRGIIDRVVAARKRGLSYTQVGNLLGMTKNQVAGYLWRWGPKLNLVRPTKRIASGRIEFPAPGHCLFISGVTLESYKFCGEGAVEGKPYCARHCAVCYVPPKEDAA